MSRFHHPVFRLAVLTLLHFLVDFYGGLLIPLPEPTLTRHFDMRIAHVALMVGTFALLVNVVQPVSAWMLPKQGQPWLLLLAPPAAALTSMIGLTHHPAGLAGLLVVAALGIGLLHPEGALAAHDVSKNRPGLGIGIFMSSGYLGFAAGSAAAGVWVEAHSPPLARFWLLCLPVFPAVFLVWLSGLHRVCVHHESAPTLDPERKDRAFPPIFLIAVGIAVSMCILVRFITILLVRRFPEAAPQGWGGTTVFATGITGAIGAFFWGGLSDRAGPERILAMLLLGAIPFLWFLIHVSTPALAPLWGLGVGFSLGAAFPLVVVLARHIRGLSRRMRMGWIIGGAWGIGEITFILGGLYLDRFSPSDPDPVRHLLYIPLFILAGAGIAVLRMARKPVAVLPPATHAG